MRHVETKNEKRETCGQTEMSKQRERERERERERKKNER